MKSFIQSQDGKHRGTRIVHWFFIILTGFFALSAWAFASPIGAPPDGDFHMASIWCAQGDRLGMCKVEKVKDSTQVELPFSYLRSKIHTKIRGAYTEKHSFNSTFLF